MSKFFEFGQSLKEYEVPVLNEREVRAAAGILLVLALIAFMNAWLVGDFLLTKIFVSAFLVDFTIRVFINPKYSPSLIVGRFFVRNQKPEYVGAPQKKFAWALGFVLAATMFYLMIIANVLGPLNFLICISCLVFLFFESAFGICIGCKIYNLFNKEKAKLCPGNVCEVKQKEEIQFINISQIIIVILFAVLIYMLFAFSNIYDKNTGYFSSLNPADTSQDCVVPDFAKALGHIEKWKLHNGCK